MVCNVWKMLRGNAAEHAQSTLHIQYQDQGSADSINVPPGSARRLIQKFLNISKSTISGAARLFGCAACCFPANVHREIPALEVYSSCKQGSVRTGQTNFVKIADKKCGGAEKIAHYMEIFALRVFLASKYLRFPHKMY